MRPIAVVPGTAAKRVRGVVASAGWEIDREALLEGEDIDAALGTAKKGRSVLFVPARVRVPGVIRRILVPHEGSPRVAGGMRVADGVAAATGAAITVLHVTALYAPPEKGSLPAPRIVDHGYDWAEWRAEFLRRFCRCSEGVDLDLEVATGAPLESILEAARRLPADLIIMTWRGEAGPGRAALIRSAAPGAPCPVLILVDGAPAAGEGT